MYSEMLFVFWPNGVLPVATFKQDYADSVWYIQHYHGDMLRYEPADSLQQ